MPTLGARDFSCAVSGFQKPGFRIPQAKVSRILDSTSKNFTNSGIRIPLHGANRQQTGIRSHETARMHVNTTNVSGFKER